MKKHLILLLLSAALLLGLTLPAAAAGAIVTTTASTATVEQEGEITFIVTVKDSPQMTAIAMDMTESWDEAVFEFVSAEWLLPDALLQDVDDAMHTAVLAYATAKDPNGDVFRFTLRVREDAPLGDTEIKATAVIKNLSEDIVCTAVGCQVTVTKTTASPDSTTTKQPSTSTPTKQPSSATTPTASTTTSGAFTPTTTLSEDRPTVSGSVAPDDLTTGFVPTDKTTTFQAEGSLLAGATNTTSTTSASKNANGEKDPVADPIPLSDETSPSQVTDSESMKDPEESPAPWWLYTIGAAVIIAIAALGVAVYQRSKEKR